MPLKKINLAFYSAILLFHTQLNAEESTDWQVMSVGYFHNHANAKNLNNKLAKLGYEVKMARIAQTASNPTAYRVMVKLPKANIDKQKAQIEQDANVADIFLLQNEQAKSAFKAAIKPEKRPVVIANTKPTKQTADKVIEPKDNTAQTAQTKMPTQQTLAQDKVESRLAPDNTQVAEEAKLPAQLKITLGYANANDNNNEGYWLSGTWFKQDQDWFASAELNDFSNIHYAESDQDTLLISSHSMTLVTVKLGYQAPLTTNLSSYIYVGASSNLDSVKSADNETLLDVGEVTAVAGMGINWQINSQFHSRLEFEHHSDDYLWGDMSMLKLGIGYSIDF